VARRAIESQWQNEPVSVTDLLTQEQSQRFREYCGVFVTLFLRNAPGVGHETAPSSRENKTLRGCIGYIYPIKPLLEAVKENAISAANRDPRFAPLTQAELNDLEIEVSVLTAPMPVASWHDIKLGTDGIVMHKNGQQSVFLPIVATEFGWDLPETLRQLSIKANCGPNGWKDNATFDVFQARAFEEHLVDS